MASGEDQHRGAIRSYRDLEVWKLSMDVAESCHRRTRQFPKEELFGMTSQMRRSSSSVPYNIAEGWGRDNRGDYVHHLRIAQGSLKEFETQVLLSQRLEYVSEQESIEFLQHTDSIGRMLRALIRSLGG